MLEQCFLTLLKVLNPTSSIHAFIKSFVVGKIKYVSRILFLLLLFLKISCLGTPETDSLIPRGSIEPRLRTTVLQEWNKERKYADQLGCITRC